MMPEHHHHDKRMYCCDVSALCMLFVSAAPPSATRIYTTCRTCTRSSRDNVQATQNEDDQRIIAYVFVLPMRRCLDVCAQFGVENRGNKTKYRNITQFDILSAPLDAGYTLNTVI